MEIVSAQIARVGRDVTLSENTTKTQASRLDDIDVSRGTKIVNELLWLSLSKPKDEMLWQVRPDVTKDG